MEHKENPFTGYELSRDWFDFCFENPEQINPKHAAIYFFAIEHCNRLGWKYKFGFPSQMVMEAIGIKNWRTYSKSLQDLVDFGFIEMIEFSKNQYSSNIIALVKNTKASTKALDKALQKHSTKQGQSTVSIDKQLTIKQFNKEQETSTKVDGLYLLSKKGKVLKGKRLDSFNRFWDCFKRKKGKADAIDAWIQIPTLTDALVDEICKAAHNTAKNRPTKEDQKKNGIVPIYAQGWISGRRWEDEEDTDSIPKNTKYKIFTHDD